MKRTRLAALKAKTEAAEPETRAERPANKSASHVSVYISHAAIVEFKRLALDRGMLSPHELYREGLDMVLERYGRPKLADIEAKG